MKPLFAIALLGLAACASGSQPPAPEAGGETDQCRARQYEYLIGRNRSDIPAQPQGATWRITCSSCAVTMDYNPNRLNIVFDDATGRIERVNCG